MSIYQKQIESEKLNNDVEAWLAKNQITELPMGYTKYPDGILPSVKTKHVSEESERNRKISELNEKIREQKAAARLVKQAERAKKLAEQKKQQAKREEQLAEQLQVLKQFHANAQYGDFSKLARLAGTSIDVLRKAGRGGFLLADKRRKQLFWLIENFKYGTYKKVTKLKLVTFKQNDDFYRRELIKMLAKDAKDKGQDQFQGKCKRHGWTQYMIKHDQTHCVACREGRHKRASETYLQNMRNSEARIQAIKEGRATYIAVCGKHGETEYKILPNKRGICIQCRRKPDFISRLQALKAARDEAIELGQTRFTFDCYKCGGNEFRITKSGSHECLGCKKKRYEAKAKPRLQMARPHMLVNQERRKEAVEQGLKDFTGLCPKHGETRFRVQKNPAYKCVKCKTEQNTRSQKANRDRYTNHPRTQELINFILGSRRGTARRLAEYFEISPTTMSHYTNGRAVLPDHHYEKFLEFKARLQGAAA